MNASRKRRLHSLETVIKPPSEQDLSWDARAVLITLRFQRQILPDWLRRAEERRANGTPPNSPQSPELQARWQPVFERVTEANTRFGELMAQGRVESIIEYLAAVGLWQEPSPPPPDAVTIIERLRKLSDEANRKQADEAGNEAA